MAECDSIELLTLPSYSGFQDQVRSQPQHTPNFGWTGRDRTYDHSLNRRTLLPLSYSPIIRGALDRQSRPQTLFPILVDTQLRSIELNTG